MWRAGRALGAATALDSLNTGTPTRRGVAGLLGELGGDPTELALAMAVRGS